MSIRDMCGAIDVRDVAGRGISGQRDAKARPELTGKSAVEHDVAGRLFRLTTNLTGAVGDGMASVQLRSALYPVRAQSCVNLHYLPILVDVVAAARLHYISNNQVPQYGMYIHVLSL
ncbi:unnamed protein product [Urochloa humidicola]